jgi:hypothetical protein
MCLVLALDAKDPRKRAVPLAQLRKLLGPKDFQGGRIAPPVPKKWEKQYRAWVKARRPSLYRNTKPVRLEEP